MPRCGVYTPHNIKFTGDNIHHIVNGHGTIISPSQVITQQSDGGVISKHTVHLTRKQHDAVNKGLMEGCGIHLHKFTAGQINHNIRAGGLFSSLYDKAKKLVAKHAPEIKSAVGNAGRKLVQKGVDKLHGYAEAGIGKLAAHAGKYIGHENAAKIATHAKKHVSNAINKGHEKLGEHAASKGYGIRRRKGGAVATRGKLWPARQAGFGIKKGRKRGGTLLPIGSTVEFERPDMGNTYRGKHATVSTGRYNLKQSGW